MNLELFAHPFSSYCWKVLIALWENDIPFRYRLLDPDHSENRAEWARLWPLEKMPLLLDDGQLVIESSIIIEHLQLRHGGPVRLIPADPAAALQVRMMDRVFDGHVMTPMMKIVADAMRNDTARDAQGVAEARQLLQKTYVWLDAQLAGRSWAAGADFTLADCAAAPALFYADWVAPIPDDLSRLRHYRARALARPSVKRAVDEARPFRPFFPPGAPDRD